MQHRLEGSNKHHPHYYRYNHYRLSPYKQRAISLGTQEVAQDSGNQSLSDTPSTTTSSFPPPTPCPPHNPTYSYYRNSNSPTKNDDDLSSVDPSVISVYEVLAGVLPSSSSTTTTTTTTQPRRDSRSSNAPPPFPCCCSNNDVANMSMDETINTQNTTEDETEYNLDGDDEFTEGDGRGDHRRSHRLCDDNASVEKSKKYGRFSCQHENNNNPSTLESANLILSRYRKRVGALLLSMTAIWIYSQLRTKLRSLRRHHRLKHDARYSNQRNVFSILFDHGRAMGIIRYLLRLIVVLPKTIVKRLTVQNYSHQSSARVATGLSRGDENDAVSTPLSHLLALAETTGAISKVIVRGSILSYLHSIPSSSSPSSSSSASSSYHCQQQQQRWSKTTLPSYSPSSNTSILKEVMSTLLQNGCHDIVTVPESIWQRFWNGPELALALPFAYSVAFYWTIRRLRRQQLDCGGDGEAAGICQRSSKSTVAATNTAATVTGVNSSVRELSDVVSYARHPDTFHSIGATLPREILLLSPLGCGKTTSCGPTRSWSMSWFYPDMSRKSSCKK